MSDEKVPDSDGVAQQVFGRRRLIQALGAAGTGMAVARWARPVVDSVVLPVHAQGSPVVPTGELFAVTGAGNAASTLYRLNPANGAVLETIGLTGFTHVTGIAFHPITGVLYGVTSTGARQLITINPNTGAGTVVDDTGLSSGLPDITFDSGGTLYAWYEGSDDLITINLTTAAPTVIGSPIGTENTGLQFDSTDTLYLKTENTLHEIDPTDGTSLGSVSVTGASGTTDNVLAWDGSVLYTIVRTAGGMELYSLVPGTGVATLLGSNAITAVSALAFS